jgi:hypothetical protein
MAYNTKSIKKDVDGKPIPQIFDVVKDDYEVLQGRNGAQRVEIYGPDGDPVSVVSNKLAVRASEVETLLNDIKGKDFATQTILSQILAKIIAAPATEAKQDTLIGHVDGVESALAAILAKIIAAPATEAKQDTIIGHVDGIEGALTTLNDKDFATQTTLATLLTKAGFDAKADIALTAFRDAIRGTGSKTLTDLATALAPLATSAKQAEAIAALGAIANAAVTDPAANGTAIALLKGLLSRIQTLENKIDSITDGTSPATVQLSGSNGVQVNSSALPTGASTEATLALIKAKTDNIPSDPSKESGKLTALETLITTLNGKIDTLNSVIDSIKDIDGIKKITDTVDVQLSGSILDKVDLSNQLLASINHGQLSPIAISSWQEIQYIVRSGLADKVFRVGDQFVSNYDTGTIVWDIIGIDHDTPSDAQFTHSLTIQAHDCIGTVQFDKQEALYYAEETLTAGAYTFNDGTADYTFTLESDIPAGGQAVLTWAGTPAIPAEIKTYPTKVSTTEIETVSVTAGNTGTTLTPINDLGRARYGSNNYTESAIRQWMNSTEASFTWVPKTNYDRPPTGALYTGAGLLKLLDPELVSVLGAVDKQVTRNTITDGGGQDLFSDKVFLLSRVEVFGGTEGTTTGEQAYPYYSTLAANPTTDALAGRIKYLNGSARIWWLRSPHTGYTYNPRGVSAPGTVNHYYAHRAYGAAPACCIV